MRLARLSVLVLLAPVASVAVVITVNPGMDSFVFTNIDPTRTATDFDVKLITVAGPGIGDGDGGAPFPFAFIGLPAVDGGFGHIVYQGGPGIPPGGMYTHSFPGWPANTMFDVEFSFPPPPNPLAIRLVSQGHFPTEGSTNSTPEPSATILVAFGLLGLVAFRQAKSSRSGLVAKGPLGLAARRRI